MPGVGCSSVSAVAGFWNTHCRVAFLGVGNTVSPVLVYIACKFCVLSAKNRDFSVSFT